MASSETCSLCGQEVRWGWREDREAYWHRDAADHQPVFGRIFTAEDKAEVERQLDLVRERHVPTETGFPLLFEVETYTAREYEEQRYMRNKKYRERQEAERDETEEDEEAGSDLLEPVEVQSTDMPHKGVLEVGGREVPVPGGVRTVLNLAAKQGWAVEKLTYSRGPYLGANGKSLGVSDCVVLRLRGPVVDGAQLRAVASWRDGKADRAWRLDGRTTPRLENMTALKTLIKEAPCG